MRLYKFLISFLLSTLVLGLTVMQPAYAEHGGGEGGGNGYIKLESFTVNLQGGEHYLQAGLSLKGGTADVAGAITARMPMVRHALILVLSSQEPDDIRTSQGKIDLMEQIKSAINKVINKTDHDGVTDVLFENFVIQ